jgi:hypothetical protein
VQIADATFSKSIAVKTRTSILLSANFVVLKLFSNIYQIVGWNPSSAIQGGTRFCNKTEGLAKVPGPRFDSYVQAHSADVARALQESKKCSRDSSPASLESRLASWQHPITLSYLTHHCAETQCSVTPALDGA